MNTYGRRAFIKTTACGLGASVMGVHANQPAAWHMPDEGEQHTCTWMAFVARREIWARKQVPEVQENLATIARTIAKYEPVRMLVREQDMDRAHALLGALDRQAHAIELIPFPLDDLWIRDTGPTFVVNSAGKKAAVDFNFNGWGEDQEHAQDAKVAGFIAQRAGVPRIETELVLEGGCFEVDGAGTAIMTESCIVNDNRNPGKSRADIDRALKHLLGLNKIIWLKGIKGRDITDGHTDFYARFAGPGQVVVSRDNDRRSFDYKVTRENIETLKAATDAEARSLELIVLDTPEKISTRLGTRDFAAGYVGYYLCNDAVILQQFGDARADGIAREKLAAAFPDRRMESLSVDGIASGGGSIHCATQQEPG